MSNRMQLRLAGSFAIPMVVGIIADHYDSAVIGALALIIGGVWWARIVPKGESN